MTQGMIDLQYNTTCDASIDAAITRVFEDLGVSVAPAIVRPEFGAEAIPGVKWSTVLLHRRGRGTPPTVPDIELVIVFFLGSAARDLGGAVARDLYGALKQGILAIVGSIVKRVTVEAVVTADHTVTYVLPTRKRDLTAALDALPEHRRSIVRSKDRPRYVWDTKSSGWQIKKIERAGNHHPSKTDRR